MSELQQLAIIISYCQICSQEQMAQYQSPHVETKQYTAVYNAKQGHSVQCYMCPGVVSSGNAWERRSQSYFDSRNGQRRSRERNIPLVIYSLHLHFCEHAATYA